MRLPWRIPFFYCGKDYILHCDSCGLHYQGVVTVDENIDKNIKPPLWMFSGLIIGILLLSFLIWDSQAKPERNRKQALEYIENPQKGDLYEVKFSENEFGLYKLDRLVGDSVYFLVNDFVVAKDYEVSHLKSTEYTDSYKMEIGYLKDELKEIVNQGYILKIDR